MTRNRAIVLAGILLTVAVTAALAQRFESRVAIRVDGRYRYIEANGIPEHGIGAFPNRNNPNTIAPQRYAFRVPAKPKLATNTTPLGLWPFGIALNGVPFDPGAAEFWNGDPRSGWQYEPLSGAVNLGLDRNNAHVQPNGAYHYHGVPVGLVAQLGDGKRMILVGYAADGFPVYARYGYDDPNDPTSPVREMDPSHRLRRGKRTRSFGPGGTYDGTFVQDYEYVAGSGDLDECNGRFGVTPEYPDGIYHYYLTDTFPFIPRRFRGTPDVSFVRRGPPQGGPGGRRPPPPPPGRRPGPPPPPPRF